MNASKGILASLLMIGVVTMAVGMGTYAYFSDTETSADNTFTAGTLDLTVDGQDDPNVFHFVMSNVKPGDNGNYTWVPKNYKGTIDGKLSINVSAITNDDNGCTEPESDVDTSCGSHPDGELGEYLEARLVRKEGYLLITKSGLGGPAGTTGWVSLNNLTGNYPDLWTLPAGDGGSTVILEWRLPTTVGNIVQSDSATFDIEFVLNQKV